MHRYLEAVEQQGIYVTLAGRQVWIDRARLGLHLQLSRLEEVDAPTIRRYMALCGVDLAGATGTEILRAFVELRILNSWQWSLPFMGDRPGETKAEPYDYPDRVWAWWIHKLASRYGWSRDEIFGLWPEEAACYLQEIFVAEFNETEQQRSLSEVSYHYDKAAKVSRFVPMAKPGWMTPKIDPKPVRVRKSILPVGMIIKLDETDTVH